MAYMNIDQQEVMPQAEWRGKDVHRRFLRIRAYVACLIRFSVRENLLILKKMLHVKADEMKRHIP